MYYAYCSLILTLKHELQWNCYTVEFTYTIVPQTYTICGGIYMQIHSLPAGGAVGVGGSEVSPVTLYTSFIRHYMLDEMKMTSKIFWRQSEIQWYKNTRTGFWFWNVQCSTKRSPHQPTIWISVGGIYFNDILMDALWYHKHRKTKLQSKRAVRCCSWKGI